MQSQQKEHSLEKTVDIVSEYSSSFRQTPTLAPPLNYVAPTLRPFLSMNNLIIYYVIVLIASILMLNIQELIVDEVFHVNQAQSFCRNSLVYDDKITTPPGPYLVSWALKYVFLLEDCSLTFLRFTNVIYGLLLPWVLMGCLGNWDAAIEQCLFPASFFFHFLYYTDSGSVFWVLVSLLTAKKRNYSIAALCSFIAMLYRQTNVVWMLFIMGLSILSLREERLAVTQRHEDIKTKNGNKICEESYFYKEIYDFLLFILVNFSLIFKKLWGFLVNGVLFGGFLYWNNGIVIGDKLNHVVAVHIPQLYYFSVFSVFFSWDYELVLNALHRLRLLYVIIMVVMGWSILEYT